MKAIVKTEHKVSYPVETTGTTGGRCALVWDDAPERVLAAQALAIVEALDKAVRNQDATVTITLANYHGGAIVRHSELGSFKGSSARDALAQMLQAIG